MSQSKIFIKNNLENIDTDFLRPKKIFALFLLCSFVIIGSMTLFFSTGTVNVRASSIPKEGEKQNLSQTISISFNKPIDRQQLTYEIRPAVVGTWQFSNRLLGNHLARTISFTPTGTYLPNQKYEIFIKNLSTIWGPQDRARDLVFTFTTRDLPGVANVSAENQTVSACDQIVASLDSANDNLADYSFQLSPPASIRTTLTDDKKSYLIMPEPCLAQGAIYRLAISRKTKTNPSKLVIKEIQFQTKKALGISSYSPSGSMVQIDTKKIEVVFEKPMVETEVLANIAIKPEIDGHWQWLDSRTLVFLTTQNMKNGTDYYLTIAKSVHDQTGGFINDNVTLNWQTIGENTP